MEDRDFTIEMTLDAPPERVYDAAATRDGIRGWWTSFTEFDDKVDSVATMRFPESGFQAAMEVVALEPPTRVHWKCVDAEHPPGVSTDRRDWVGTEVMFEIYPVGDGRSRLRFTHVGLVPLECHDTCSNIWDFYIRSSLAGLVEKGRGAPTT